MNSQKKQELFKDNFKGVSEIEFFKLLDTAKKSQDYHDEIHINFKTHKLEDMRTGLCVFPTGSDKFNVKYQNKDLVLDLPDLLKEISKNDIKSIYTYSEVQSRNELHSEIKFSYSLNEEDIKKLKGQLNEIEKKSENRALELKTWVIEEKNFTSIKDKIIQQYSSECPYIKHINDKTAEAIDTLNKEHGKKLSVNELKSMYKEVGSYLENSFVKETFIKFKELDSIVSDLKHAHLNSMQESAKEKTLSIQNKNLSKNMEQNL